MSKFGDIMNLLFKMFCLLIACIGLQLSIGEIGSDFCFYLFCICCGFIIAEDMGSW